MTSDIKNTSYYASFWDHLDQLAASSSVKIDRPRNTAHPRYPKIIYPLDYGYLEGTTTIDGGCVDIWVGAFGSHDLVGIILTVDFNKHDTEVKLLLGCTEKEMQIILEFQKGSSMRAILIHKPNDNKVVPKKLTL